MNVDSVRKEVEIHSVHSAHNAPIARLRSRFGSWALPTPVLAMPLPIMVEGKRHEPPPSVSPWDLPPDLYERWEERVCIMHYDGGLPWDEAETLALADILGRDDSEVAPETNASIRAEAPKVEQTAGTVQATLFAGGQVGYGRGL